MEVRNYSLEKRNGKTIAVATPGVKYYLDSDEWKPLSDNVPCEVEKALVAPLTSKSTMSKTSMIPELENNISSEENVDIETEIEPEPQSELDIDYFFNATVEIDNDIDGYKSASAELDIEASASISFTGVASTGATGSFEISAETGITIDGNKNANVALQIESEALFDSSASKQTSVSVVIPITSEMVFVCRKSAFGIVDLSGNTDVVIVGINGVPSHIDVASINRSVAYLRINSSKAYLRNNKSNAIIN